MKYFLIKIFLLIVFLAFNQKPENNDISHHYVLTPCSDTQFFEDVYNSIGNVGRIFPSTCFYFNELLKNEKIYVDTFDMLTPSNYYLLKTIFDKHDVKNIFGFHVSSYYAYNYFKTFVEVGELRKMNDVLNKAKFKKSHHQYFLDQQELKNLHAAATVELEDSSLVQEFLSYLPDSIYKNKYLNILHSRKYLGEGVKLDSIFHKKYSVGQDITVDFKSYELTELSFHISDLFNKKKLNLVFFPTQVKIRYHIAINGCDEVKKTKLKRLVTREFDLKRRDLKCGNIIELLNGDEVKIYCY